MHISNVIVCYRDAIHILVRFNGIVQNLNIDGSSSINLQVLMAEISSLTQLANTVFNNLHTSMPEVIGISDDDEDEESGNVSHAAEDSDDME